MKKTTSFYTSFLALLLTLFALQFAQAQEEIAGDGGNGYKLFKKNCTACHEMDQQLIGPALRGVVGRLQSEQGLGRDWLQKWIKNNAELRASGDVYANEVYNKYNQTAMNNFPDFSEQDIDDILVYTNDPEAGLAKFEADEAAAKAAEDAKKAAAGAGGGSGGGNDAQTGIFIIGFSVLAALLTWILLRLSAFLKLTRTPELMPQDEERVTDFASLFEKYKKFAGLGLGVLGLLAFLGLWNFLLGIGVDKGYKPEQPIYFSHKVHNGLQGIDCQYCHSSAKYGKFSNIPSSNLCMNCHKNIPEYNGESEESQAYLAELVKSGAYEDEDAVKQFYTSEIHKMYESIGWDKDAKEFDSIQKPIKWVKIHNLPDFVYFPHSQHVVVGEKAIKGAMDAGTIPNAEELGVTGNDPVCYACHGQVGQMDEVYMANEFTMGWCIECHRSTEVDMENGYNKEYYAELHEKLKKEYGEDTKITVDAIGGLECGKCHY